VTAGLHPWDSDIGTEEGSHARSRAAHPPQLHDDGCHRAARLLKPMLDLGISRDHPDPVTAIEDAQKL